MAAGRPAAFGVLSVEGRKGEEMTSKLDSLERELERTLLRIKEFREFRGAVDFPTLKLAMNGLPDEQVVRLAIYDSTGFFFRGVITSVDEAKEQFGVLADDGDYVTGVKANQVLAVRIQDKK